MTEYITIEIILDKFLGSFVLLSAKRVKPLFFEDGFWKQVYVDRIEACRSGELLEFYI